MADTLAMSLQHETRQEAFAISHWWQTHVPDDGNGFWGEIAADGAPVKDAPRAVILYTRLLWFFSAMASYLDSSEALELAHRAAAYIRDRFVDPDHGGLYWLLDAKGQVVDAKKQGYAQAFGIYAFAEYYRITQDPAALDMARRLQREIEERFWEPEHGGYIEALSAVWLPRDDQRLSDKDIDAPKTMNTHLHIVEAYTHLHRVAPDDLSHAALYRALDIFADRFVDPQTHHLRLFYDLDWSDRTHAVSYGHDIEASWLMWEAAAVLSEPALTARVKPLVIGLAEATLKDGVMLDGSIAYEQDFDGRLDPAGEWWGQAEAMVGFVNAWELTGNRAYLDATEKLWRVLKAQFGAGGSSEWTWYAKDACRPPQVRAGQWKCPYHNGRAMIELDERLSRIRT
ncbi:MULTISPECIES: AGE family epimerase/isomerase [Asticcacaulis]|uniref:AGE family epimerase/isomerase n=1 Tax=Asticcacaulis TaxID=76890 RepID=UPI001FDABDE8|nr:MULTISPECIES: AGE family epimerase/isomerase [Asticcacaulis]MBP2160504.1 mannobiose 2-epimerase [Asticcacaulis solisilvae]MDR6801549.1 mannobiose 2-epimerase [Asticcacaulis sp. BE141]